MYRTQKARGVALLSERYGTLFKLYDPKADLDQADYFEYPVFARPCPVRPRHGFVDSRIVNNAAELQKLGEEVLQQDPDGEIVIMPFIDAKFSGVLTNGLCAIGPGNDGVTAGRDGCFKFPMSPMKELLHLASISGIEGAPYIEFVGKLVVQLRDGPKAADSDGDSWIPKAENITRLHKPGPYTTLLEWEQLVAGLGIGDAVYLPGHTMLSHHAVHAVCAGRPIFFGDNKPKLPFNAVPSSNIVRYTGEHITALRSGINHGTHVPLSTAITRKCAAFVATIAAHHGPSLLQSVNGCFIIGLGASLMIRLGFSAVLGEWRHHQRIAVDRNIIYEKSLEANWRSQTDLIIDATWSFEHGKWKSGFGGEPWAICAKAASGIAAEVGNGNNVNHILRALNNAIHVAHNNGKWLDKFFSTEDFNGIANGSVIPTISGVGCVWKLFKTERDPAGLPDMQATNHDEFFAHWIDGGSSDESDSEDNDESDDDNGESNEHEDCKCSMCQPKADPVVQWVEKGNIFHFQGGRPGSYDTWDASALISKKLGKLEHQEVAKSLAGSDTNYYRTTPKHLLEQAKQLNTIKYPLDGLIDWIKKNVKT
jgi:hypothetical protein